MFDERFILHRYKSTSYAGISCALMVLGLFMWNFYAKDTFRTDLAIIVGITCLVKIGCMAWFRLRD